MQKLMFVFLLLAQFSAHALSKEIKINSIDDLKKCGQTYSRDTGACFPAFEKFVAKNPSKVLEAAKIGRTIFVQWAVLPTFEKAYNKSKSIEICKDTDFQLSLFNSLGQPPESESYKIALKFLKGVCGPHLIEMAMKELDVYNGPAVLENLCPLIKANGKTHKTCEPKVTSEKVEIKK